jgi:anti-sigma regulatory factor (Ser/Thr protein kinase)
MPEINPSANRVCPKAVVTFVDRYSQSRLDRGAARRRHRRALDEAYPAVGESVPLARRRLVGFAAAAGADLDQLDAIRLAASEALSNAVQHAYPDGPGKIDVAAWMVLGELWILIADDGCGLHADRERAGLGLGLALISQVSDGFVVMERSSGGTEVRMRFDLEIADEPSLARVRFLR